MSVPQPWPRRPPILLAVLAVIALVNVGIGVVGVVDQGSTGFRWLITALWAGTTVLCVLGWRHQRRRFRERTAELERTQEADGRSEPGPPSA